MDRVLKAMSLIHDLVVKLEVLWNHKVVLEPYNSIGILSEAFSFTQLYPPADVTRSNVRSLSDDDVFLDSWNESYVAQSTIWNNSDHNKKCEVGW
jgi:hypothetical protein